MTTLEIVETGMMKPFMKVVFDLDRNMEFQTRDWEAIEEWNNSREFIYWSQMGTNEDERDWT